MKLDELKKILKRLYKEYIKIHIKRIIISLLLSIVVAASTSGTAWLLDPAVKKIFIDKDTTLAWLIPIAIIFVFAAKGISLYFARINIIIVGERCSGELRKQIASNILTSDIQTLDNRHSGKYISNMMYDAANVQNLVSTGVLNLMKDSFSVIALVSLMFYQNWKLALFAILLMPLAGGLAKSLGKRIGKATGEASEISGRLTTFLAEIFKGSRMIRIYQKEKTEEENSARIIDELVSKNEKIASIMIRAQPIMETLTGFMIAGFIFYSGKLIAMGELDVNSFFSFLAAMMLAYQPIRSLATLNMVAYQGAAAAKRIFSVIDEPVEIEEIDSQVLAKKFLPDVKIYKNKNTYKLLRKSKVVVSMLSSVITEAIILDKPVVMPRHIKHDLGPHFVSTGAVLTIDKPEDALTVIKKALYDDQVKAKLKIGREKFLKEHLAYRGKSTEKTLELIKDLLKK